MVQLKTLVVTAIAIGFGLIPTDTQAQEVSRIVGTWVFNQAASTCLGGACPRRLERTYEDRGDGRVRATFRGLESSQAARAYYTARHDGTDYRFVLRGETGNRTMTIALTRVNDYTSNWWVTTLDGAVYRMGQSTVSADGKTYTETTSGGSVLVFDRR